MRCRARTSAGSLVTAALILWCCPLYASAQEDYEETQKAIEQSRQHQAELSEKALAVEAELQPLQEKMVRLADTIQKGELVLNDSEDKLRILSDQLKEKNDNLKKHQKSLNSLMLAALALSHTPPEAMIMMPTGAMESMKASRALKMASDEIRREADIIGVQLVELKKLEQKVEQNHEIIANKQVALDRERKVLTSQLAERSELQKKLGEESQQELEKLAKLAKKAQDFKDLVSSVEKEESKHKGNENTADDEDFRARERNGRIRSFIQAKGHIRPPIAGKVVQSFGASQGKNATSKGIIINARPGARVTAPYDGEVVFTGPFLNYGQMVIIRHSDEFHTLLAGLVKIDVGVGQFLLEGEPIGAMGESDSGNKLYIELRKNNQPVNPVLWISGLNKKN